MASQGFKINLDWHVMPTGRRIVEELSKRQVRIFAAFWYHYEDEDDWKLLVVSPDFEDQGPQALYTMISQMLSELSSDSYLYKMS